MRSILIPRRWRAALLCGLGIAAPSAGVEPGEGTHFTDSSRERIPLVTAFPKYPSIARRERIEGEATVCFRIDERGRVIRPSVRSSSNRIFNRAALRAIRSSSFEPLAPGQTLKRSKTCRTYRFRLDPVTARN